MRIALILALGIAAASVHAQGILTRNGVGGSVLQRNQVGTEQATIYINGQPYSVQSTQTVPQQQDDNSQQTWATNPRTGAAYPVVPGADMAINPSTGAVYPRSGSGYIDPQTGRFFPGN